ncbi:MAG: mucoidy inhibitor MuiA family protein [Chloroflexi bacterium]|nr:mucoidy inhibitor MuiA family protein [Chloroflexota bacterium]
MTELNTSLEAVVVFPDRARITRRGMAVLQPGVHLLEVSGLPLAMNPDSLRAAARGSARARLLSAQCQRVFSSEAPAGRAGQLEAEIDAVQDALKSMDARGEAARQSRAALEALSAQAATYAAGLTAGETSLEAHLALMDGLRARMEALDGEMLSAAPARREAERRLARLKKELEQLASARPRERYCAVVEVEALTSGELSVELHYLVVGASWQPLYDLRLLEEDGAEALEVGYLAQVSQQTGEDWTGAALTLSTARPALAGVLPELKPVYLRVLPPPRPPVPATRSFTQDASFGEVMPAPAMETQGALPVFEAEAAAAAVESEGVAVTYTLPAAANIPSDGAPHKVTVARFRLTPRLDYVSAPRLVEAAYRRARAANDSPYTLLEGAANLFAGEEFIGASTLKMAAPGGELELFLGVDDRLKVQRKLKRSEVDKSLIGGKRRAHRAYEITLENLSPAAARLTLHDQFPVAQHEDIKVRLDSAEPKPAKQSELNLLEWELSLAPGEKKTVRFDFSIETPHGVEATGLGF